MTTLEDLHGFDVDVSELTFWVFKKSLVANPREWSECYVNLVHAFRPAACWPTEHLWRWRFVAE
jgi:hypothetical protein